jgi:hypothetical protein
VSDDKWIAWAIFGAAVTMTLMRAFQTPYAIAPGPNMGVYRLNTENGSVVLCLPANSERKGSVAYNCE